MRERVDLLIHQGLCERSPGPVYTELRRFLDVQTANLDAADPLRVTELRDVVAAQNPYRGAQLQQAKSAFEAVRIQVNAALEQTRVRATAEIKERVEALKAVPEFERLDDAARKRILGESEEVLQRVLSQPLLPVIRDTVRQYTESGYQRQLAEIARHATPPPDKGAGVEPTSTAKETPSAFVSIRELATPLGRAYLGTEGEVDEYIAALAERLRAAVLAGKRITP